MLRSPRERFVSSTHLDAFKNVAQSECFEEATMIALLELEREMPIQCTPQQSVDSYQQLVGARRYLEILCSLILPSSERKTSSRQELDYKAGV